MGAPLSDVAEERSVKFHDECEAMLMAKEVGVAEKSGAQGCWRGFPRPLCRHLLH